MDNSFDLPVDLSWGHLIDFFFIDTDQDKESETKKEEKNGYSTRYTQDMMQWFFQ